MRKQGVYAFASDHRSREESEHEHWVDLLESLWDRGVTS
jgi:hypothetical protein